MRLIFTFFITAFVIQLSATEDTAFFDTTSVYMEIDDSVITNFEENLDSLDNLYYMQDKFLVDSISVDSLVEYVSAKDVPDSVYIERLARIPSVVDLSFNSVVRRYIEIYTGKRRELVEKMLGLSEYYFPIFDEIFDYYDVPNEMKYMSIIESALNPRAYSRARAVGLWQFMYGTGRLYGLEINSLVDERRDPIKSTHAAAKFAKNLYHKYGDWILAIAAYNCGPGNVNKAIRRSGGKRNYWDMYYYLPRETRGHVPAFIAATYVMHYYEEHGIVPKKTEMPLLFDTIMINDDLHLMQVSEVLGLPVRQLRDLNPQYRADIIPGKTKSYALVLPEENIYSFIDLQDSILAYKDSVFFNKDKMTTSPTTTYARYTPVLPGDKYAKLYYTVKSGDAVGLIAEWYDVRLSDLRYWNNIRRNLIRSGQKLVIYVPKNKVNKYRKIDNMTFAEKQKMIGKTVTGPAPQTTVSSSDMQDYIIYTVKSGDTLWDIAKKYPGVTDTDIMRLNNLKNGDRISPGQKLKIKPKG